MKNASGKINTVGRFAPTPSGRMHLGNIMTAMLAYLSAKSAGGKCLLRIENLDSARCSAADAQNLLSDLGWLGFKWDGEIIEQGGRGGVYKKYFELLSEMGLIYPCYCSRGELAASAPHGADGQVLYGGKCRAAAAGPNSGKPPCYRIKVPEETITLTDGVQGSYRQHLAKECSDFILRRADGVYAYQLAVVIDDALSGVTEVVRGRDLLSSAPRQIYLYRLLGFRPPAYFHTPLLLSIDGRRMSKSAGDSHIAGLRAKYPPEAVVGMLAYSAGLTDKFKECSLSELTRTFSWDRVKKEDIAADCFKECLQTLSVN